MGEKGGGLESWGRVGLESSSSLATVSFCNKKYAQYAVQ